jgi:hypothetical protein
VTRRRNDFRAEAALRSEEILRERGVDPLGELRGVGRSLCVLIDPDGVARSRSIEMRTAALYLFAIGQFFAVLIGGAAVARLGAPDWVMFIMVGLDVVSGVGMVLVFYFRRGRDIRLLLEELRGRPNCMVPGEPGEPGDSEVPGNPGVPGDPGETIDPADRRAYFVVDLQRRKGATTFAVFRDDQAVIVPDPDHGCVLIESRGYRHVIFQNDVLLFNPVTSGGAVGVDIVYHVDGIEVPLHMYAQSIADTFRSSLGRAVGNPIAQSTAIALSG